jgi:hypothetical protein
VVGKSCLLSMLDWIGSPSFVQLQELLALCMQPVMGN